jgi:nucleotide-binding universal stress UspA family protein
MDAVPIVVGYDGSADARIAVRWAVDEAARRSVPLRLVYAVPPEIRTSHGVPMPWGDSIEEDIRHAEESIATLTAELTGAAPAVAIEGVVAAGSPMSVLHAQSLDAQMIVVGSRGLGGFTGLFLGSVSAAVAAHARCPVVVVRDGDPVAHQQRPVMVGVDDAAHSAEAIGFAFDEAALRGVDLVAVRAWSPPAQPWRSDVRPLVLDVDELETAERHAVNAALDGWREKYPGVNASVRVVPGDARRVLTTVSEDAQLLVVGFRGRGGFIGLTLGSVSHYVLQHASCPIAVLRVPAPTAAG